MIIAVLVVLGLCFGSFVNALVYRIHEQSRAKTMAQKKKLSIMHGRSLCPSCKHVLEPLDLIPVLSWLLLRGRCRYCRKAILDTPFSELLTPVLFVLSYTYWPEPLQGWELVAFGFWLVLLVGLVALLVYDLRWYLLPNRLVYPSILLAGLQVVLAAMFAHQGTLDVLGAAFWGFITGGGIFWLLFQVSGGRWIGGGDVKLGGLLGMTLGGPVAGLLMIFVASLLGTVVGIPLLLTKRLGDNRRLPFGPFLIIAAVLVQLFGSSLIAWYKRQVGL